MGAVGIWDANFLLHRSMRIKGQVSTLCNRNGKATGGIFTALKSIKYTLGSTTLKQCYMVFDSGISERRRVECPEYKGARYRKPGDPFYVPLSAESKEYLMNFRSQRNLLMLILPMLGFRVIRFKGVDGRWEADDLIYALSHMVGNQVYVISDDRDMLQMVIEYHNKESKEKTGFIRNIRPIARELITERNFEAEVGYPIAEFFIRKCILGDKSDNISKVPGCGKDTVAKMFDTELAPVVPYPFSDFILWCAEHKSKRVNKISDNMDILLRNYELMNIANEDMSKAQEPLRRIVQSPVHIDMIGVKRILTELDIFSITKELGNWILPFQRLR